MSVTISKQSFKHVENGLLKSANHVIRRLKTYVLEILTVALYVVTSSKLSTIFVITAYFFYILIKI